MKKVIAVLPGDGIGEEVCREAIRVLDAVAEKFGHEFGLRPGLIGGAAWEQHNSHFPDETKALCEASDAILFGSVGGPVELASQPKWKDCEKNSILALRQAFSFNANFRPARVYPELVDICPLRPEVAGKGVDLLIIRELLGDVYFGEHRREVRDGKRVAVDVGEYTEDQVASVAHIAFQAAEKRDRSLVSVDKANVLETSRLWREVVDEVATEYPDVKLEHMFVDNAAMQIIRDPSRFDVVVTGNLFGDILSDAAAVLPGSLGLTASASLNGEGFGMYEPQGGSAPDLAGQNVANPLAQILSVSMLLRFSFGLNQEADLIVSAVDRALAEGSRTADIADSKSEVLSTTEMCNRVIANLE